ncbi:MAG: peptidoglycan-binding protein [Clostridia bacterium]|nr:peptidoglycan-binding protein [Clostridia bacterium]
MKKSVIKRIAMLAVLCALVTVLAVPSALAASYSKVYGQTQDRVRVRESASTNATIIDNIVKNGCVYVLSSKTSGGSTFIQVRYRAVDGDVETGWVCQSDGRTTYVKILSATQAESVFSVKGGNLPSKRVGTFTDAQRKASQKDSDNTYIRPDSNGETVKDVQTKLKALKYYSGEITGNVGNKTEAAIKAFQRDYNLTADGIAGPATLAKLDAVYAQKGGNGGDSGSGGGLRLNSNGAAVRTLQQNLTKLGYYWAEITGNFGAKTETAVKRFQEENGLKPDGVAGAKTLAAIEKALKNSGLKDDDSQNDGSVLKLNSQGTKVSKLQTDLKTLGYYYADITGNFGAKTEAAVKKFQQDKGLTADGVAGAKTLAAIEQALKNNGVKDDDGNTKDGLKLGSTGPKVSALQKDLTTLGYYYGDITGHFGSLTQQAVKKFQKAKGLTQDGVAGTTTLNAISKALKDMDAPQSDNQNKNNNSLREGDGGAAVTELQTMLKQLKYYYGDITGHFGSLTRKAVRAFQDAEGLTVDGVAGPATINRLRTLTGGSPKEDDDDGATVKTENSYGRITKDNVYLRSSYSTTSAAKASLSKGTLLRITKSYVSGGVRWYYVTVKVGNYVYNGYVRSDMMEIITEDEYNKDDKNEEWGEEETIGMIRVTGNNVALRYEPSTSADRVGTANVGDVFYYVNTVSGWYKTKAGYWISSSYAKVMTEKEIEDYLGKNGTTYRYDDTGSMVEWIQQALKQLGYYSATVSGHFGAKTEQAVKDFQADYGLTVDGVVGPTTLARLRQAVSGNNNIDVDIKNKVFDMSWFTAKNNGVLSKIGFTRGKTATLTDLRTGKSLRIYIQSTGNHADVEPSTAADTSTLCDIYGVAVAKDIGYQARPMLVTVGGYNIVCSIYGEAHGAQTITNNNYDGQFCLHFSTSRTHNSNAILQRHVDAINEAKTILTKQGKTVVVLDDQGDLN